MCHAPLRIATILLQPHDYVLTSPQQISQGWDEEDDEEDDESGGDSFIDDDDAGNGAAAADTDAYAEHGMTELMKALAQLG